MIKDPKINPVTILKRLFRFGHVRPGRIVLALHHLFVSPGPAYTLSLWYSRRLWRRRILKTGPVTTAASSDVCIRYLISHDHVLEGIWAAKSLLADERFRAWELTFHDDGTLTLNDERTLHRHFPSAIIVWRRDADAVVPNSLLPACKVLRDKLVLAKKLFDFAYFSGSRPYLCLDTDVLFFSRADDLHEALTSGTRIRYNQDPPSSKSFSHSVQEIYERTGLRPERFNSGVLAIPSPSANVSRIEAWLQALGTPTSWMVEQTMYALIAFSEGSTPLPKAYDILEYNWPDVVSEHYYWRSRRNMYRYGYPRVYAERLDYCRH